MQLCPFFLYHESARYMQPIGRLDDEASEDPQNLSLNHFRTSDEQILGENVRCFTMAGSQYLTYILPSGGA